MGKYATISQITPIVAPIVEAIIPDVIGTLPIVENDDPRLADARQPLPHEHNYASVDHVHPLEPAAPHDHNSLYAQLSDTRLSDARTPLPHTHPQGEISGLTTTLNSKVDSADSRLSDARTPLGHVHAQSDITGLTGVLGAKEATVNKGVANGYASLDATGKVPSAQLPASGGGLWTRTVLSADVTNNNAVANTLQDVTGLSFPVVAGQRYWFRFFIFYTAQATTTGSRWTINGPAFTGLSYMSEYSLTGTTTTRNAQVIAYNSPAASNATSAATGPSNMAQIEGFIQPSANGIVIARFASEVLNSAITAKSGSFVEWTAV